MYLILYQIFTLEILLNSDLNDPFLLNHGISSHSFNTLLKDLRFETKYLRQTNKLKMKNQNKTYFRKLLLNI